MKQQDAGDDGKEAGSRARAANCRRNGFAAIEGNAHQTTTGKLSGSEPGLEERTGLVVPSSTREAANETVATTASRTTIAVRKPKSGRMATSAIASGRAR